MPSGIGIGNRNNTIIHAEPGLATSYSLSADFVVCNNWSQSKWFTIGFRIWGEYTRIVYAPHCMLNNIRHRLCKIQIIYNTYRYIHASLLYSQKGYTGNKMNTWSTGRDPLNKLPLYINFYMSIKNNTNKQTNRQYINSRQKFFLHCFFNIDL